MRCRIDFKYALAMDLDDPGFHHSVLTDFRDRLGRDGRADQLLSLALDRIRDAGMIEERGRQRTDSTQILAAARELTRLELVLEAVRAALEEASRDTPDVLDDLVDADWATRYGRPVRLPAQPSHPVTRLKQAGADAPQLLQSLPPHRRGPRAGALRQIMVQNFLVDARGALRPRTEKDGRPKGVVRIISPYDPDARQAVRGNTRWNGYLVHVTETCDTDARVNLITDIATTSLTRDTQALPGIHTRLRDRRLLPAQHLVDGGYISTALLNDAARHHRIQLVGPVKAGGARQKKEQTGFTRDDFTIDFDRHQVTCPNGRTSTTWVEAPAMAPCTAARFASSQCDPCPDRPACTRGKSARTVNFLPRRLHELQARNLTDPARPPLETALRHPVRRRRHHLRTRQRPPSPPKPLPRPPQDPRPTRPDRHRHQHRTPRLTNAPPPPQRSHSVPALPRRTRPDLGMLVAARQMNQALKIPDRVPHCPATRFIASSPRSPFSLSTTSPTDSAGPTGDAAIRNDHAPVITGDKPQLRNEDHDVGAAGLPAWPLRMRSNQSAVSSAHRPGEPATWTVPTTDP